MSKTEEGSTYGSVLFARMQDLNRSWLERLRGIRDLEADYGGRLLKAKGSTEAAAICNEWMAKRLEAVANDHRAFTAAWLDLVSDNIRSAVDATKTKPVVASEKHS